MKISLPPEQAQLIQALVESGQYGSADEVVSTAIRSLFDRNRLAVECAKLNPQEEKNLAEEGMEFELEAWSKY